MGFGRRSTKRETRRGPSLNAAAPVAAHSLVAAASGAMDAPLPSSARVSGFQMPRSLFFRRTATGHVAVSTDANPAQFDAPLFVLSTTRDDRYETLAVNDSAVQRARLASLLPIRVASPSYPTFGMDLILASQSPFSSNAEFESVDMYGYKFSLSVAQPPGTKRSDTVATFTYHSTDYQFSRTQLHSTLLNPLAYSSPNTSTLLHFGNGEGSIQMDLTSRRKGRLFAKEKFSSFATAEASRGAFFHQYAMEMRDQENKFLQLHQRSSPAPQYSSSFDNVYNNTSSVSLGRNQPARSSSISPDGSLRAQDSKGEWQLRFSQNGAQSFTGRSFSTVQSYPHQGASPNHSSMNMVNGGISSSSLDRASSASSTMPRFPGRASTLSHESYPPLNGWAGDRFEDTSSFARRSFSQRSTLPRGPNIPMPIKAPSGSFKNSQLAATLSQMTDNDKYPVFGVIHLSDESICVSEAEGLKDLMLLVGTVYAVWSRSVLKPLEKLEYHHLNRTNSTSF